MSGQKILGIIPARSGSKGIPSKNTRLVGGKPLLAWSIAQARQTPQVSRVFVSTDSEEIAAVAREYGAEVIMRPPEISGDAASSESALIHALDWLERPDQGPQTTDHGLRTTDFRPPISDLRPPISDLRPPIFDLRPPIFDLRPPISDLRPLTSDLWQPDLVVFLQATSPLREPDDIQKAIETLEREQADSLFSACRAEGFTWRVEKDGTPRSFTYDHLNRPRRQDAPEDLIENGSIYIFKPWVLRKFNNRLGGKVAVYRMPALQSFQIDEPADIELVEALMEFRHRTRGQKSEVRSQKSQNQNLEFREQPPGVSPSHVLTTSDLRSPTSDLWPWPLTTGPGLRPLTSDLCKIKLLVLDFDGVLTDNRVLVTETGYESVYCSRADGLGLEMLPKSGRVEVVVISTEKNPVVAARCRKLGIECIQGCEDKLAALRQRSEVSGQRSEGGEQRSEVGGRRSAVGGLKPEEIAYVGNDVNDLACLRWVGLPIAVADAVPEVLAVAKWVTTKPGGLGAVREVCDHLLRSI